MASSKQRKVILEELEELAPNLAKLKQAEKPLDIPADYFAQLSTELLQEIGKEQSISATSTNATRQSFWQRLLELIFQPSYAMAIAGVAILIIGFSIFDNSGTEIALAEEPLSDEEINNYIESHLDDFDLNLLAEELPVDPLELESLLEENDLEENDMKDFFDNILDDVDLEDLL